VDTYTSLLNRLAAMNAPIPDALAFIMFLSSLQGHLRPQSRQSALSVMTTTFGMMSLPASSKRPPLRGPGLDRIQPSPSILAQFAHFAVVKATKRIVASRIPRIRTTVLTLPRRTHRLSVLAPTDVQRWFILLTPTARLSRRLPFRRTLPSLHLQNLLQRSTRRGPATEEDPFLSPPCGSCHYCCPS
jgi:hypothetical protein